MTEETDTRKHRHERKHRPDTEASTIRAGSPAAAWRVLWVACGVVALALGVVGVVLPLLPTTPFVLLAAFCFAKGDPRLEARMLAHPRLGPAIMAWRNGRVVPRRAKWLASGMMLVGCAVAVARWDGWIAWLPTAICCCVAIWLWRHPEKPPERCPVSR